MKKTKEKNVNSNESIYNKSREELENSYLDELEEAIKDEEIKNIAIIGSYGAGKTHLIKRYEKEKNKCIKHKKSFTISLASFGFTKNGGEQNKISNKNESNEREKEIINIEKSILQQVLFKEPAHKLPDSSISRIRINFKQISFILLYSLIMLLTSVGSILLYRFLVPNYENKCLKIISIIILVCILICFGIIVFQVMRKIKLTKIKLKDFEADFAESSNGNLFDKYIDEIIYFFFKTHYRILYIEDLDRLNNYNIFTKLRELNNILNNSTMIKNKITFVYCIGEGVFKDVSDRSKFFDKIISIIPYVNVNSIKDILKEWFDSELTKEEKLKGQTSEKTEKFINQVKYYILDPRICNNIKSDYKFYISNKKDDIEFDIYSVLSVMIYKNLYPEDFSKFQRGEGDLKEIFHKTEIYKQKLIDKIEEEIEEKNNKIREINDSFIKNVDDLKMLFYGALLDAGEISSVSSYGNITKYNDYNKIDFEKANDGDYFRKKSSNYIIYGQYGDINKKFKEKNDKDFKELYESLKDYEDSNKQKLIVEIDEKNNKIVKIHRYSISQTFIELEKEKIEYEDDILRKYNFLKMAIRNGYIDENCLNIAVGFSTSISNEDIYFINKVNNKETLAYDYKLDNWLNVVKEIGRSRFSDKYILNNDLVLNIIKFDNNKDEYSLEIGGKAENLIAYLNGNSTDVDKFLKNYMKSQDRDNILTIIRKLKSKKDLGVLVYENVNENDNDKSRVFEEILNNDYQCIHDDKFINILNEYPKLSEINFTEDICKELKDNLKIKNVSGVEREDQKKLIYENLLFDFNKENLKDLAKYYGCKDDNKTVSTLLSISHEELKKELLEGRKKIVEIFMGDNQYLEEDQYKEILKNDFNEEDVDDFISNYETKLTKFDDLINDKTWVKPQINVILEKLCKNNRFENKISVLFEVYKNTNDVSNMIEYFNTDNLPKMELDIEINEMKKDIKLINFVYSILNLKFFDFKDFEYILNMFSIDKLNLNKLSITYSQKSDKTMKKYIDKIEVNKSNFVTLKYFVETLVEICTKNKDGVKNLLINEPIDLGKDVCDSIISNKQVDDELKAIIIKKYGDKYNLKNEKYTV